MKLLKSLLVLVLLLGFTSCEELLEVTDITGEQVVLVAPSDSTLVTLSNVNFTWAEVLEAKSYRIQVAQPSFLEASQIVVDTIVVIDSVYSGPNLSKVLLDSSYEWRVKAMNSDFETKYSVNSFRVQTGGN